jgi:type VI secretion system secreted protein VgrG
LNVFALTGQERLGIPSRFDLELLSPEPIDPAAILGAPATLRLTTPFAERPIHGIVTRITAIATSQPEPARRYKLTLQSAFHLLTLRRRTRVFQHLTVPAILQQFLKNAGLPDDQFAAQLIDKPAERTYVTQYAETDATFVRRLCEEEGFYFRFEPRDGFDAFVLEDDSRYAPAALDAPLPLMDEPHLHPDRPAAYACESTRKRRPGKVTLRDYSPANPALHLEGASQAGNALEQGTEVYSAPGRFKTPDQGTTRARILLESLRAEATTIRFETTAVSLAPGLHVELECTPDYAGTARPEGKFLIVEIQHAFRRDSPRLSLRVTAIPLEVPYRLPIITPKPKISGVHSAIVTGAPGEEIHTDAGGHIKVRFPWDRTGPTDDKSSLPVRVMQPNLPGAMLLPRVGWEVLVAFEDSDPDRPYVLGRTYNAKQPPPFALPANKTITALSTVSSPGGARQNAVHFDDAAGRQHMVWNAGFGKTTKVGNNMLTQTVGFDQTTVKGSQTFTIGGSETVSVTDGITIAVGSQSGKVGGSQTLTVKGAAVTAVGSEDVRMGGALIEQVGNPVSGALDFARATVMSGAGYVPVIGPALARGMHLGTTIKALSEGYAHGGIEGLTTVGAQQALGALASEIPAGDALVAAADAAGLTPWSEKARKASGDAEAGGGTGGPGAAGASAAQAAPGHRKTIVDGAMTESIGEAYTVTTPGSIKWTTAGVSNFIIGGHHTTGAVRVSRLTGGVSTDTAASLTIDTDLTIGRDVKGALKTSITGSLSSTANGAHSIKTGRALTIKVSGSLEASGGAVVFMADRSIVAAHSGGVLLKASKVVINGKATQSGKATNQ